MEKEITLAATYQTTDNLAGVFPEVRYGAAVGISISENLEVAVEYMHDEDYTVDEGGRDESADAYTMQIALAF